VPEPGVDVYVVDEYLGGVSPLATDTVYLLDPAGPAVAVKKTRPDVGNVTADNALRALFQEGARSIYLQGIGDGTTKPLPADAVAALPAGPGNIVAPSLVTSADHVALANAAWPRNKVCLFNGASTLTVAQLQTLSAAIIAGAGGLDGGGRGAALFAGQTVYANPGGTGTYSVPLAVSVAGVLARNDRLYLKPNMAPAGANGILRAIGITQTGAAGATVYTPADISTLYASQVNAARLVPTPSGAQVRNYGAKTLADLTVLEHWWDFPGSRAIMEFRSRATVVDEQVVFDNLDGEQITLSKYGGLLRGEASEMWRRGALFGQSPSDAYEIVTDATLNPIDQLAEGEAVATCRLKVSPHIDHLVTNIVRRPIGAEL
jgi:hypothetical protein